MTRHDASDESIMHERLPWPCNAYAKMELDLLVKLEKAHCPVVHLIPAKLHSSPMVLLGLELLVLLLSPGVSPLCKKGRRLYKGGLPGFTQ